MLMIKTRLALRSICACAALLLLSFSLSSAAENIDPDNDVSRYAYGENIGWIDLEADTVASGVEVGDTGLTGYMWGENVGWINLSPSAFGGVVNDGLGNLSGNAWGEHVGWINFAPDGGGVTIDPDTGVFDGYAWGENCGWISFQGAGAVAYGVVTAWRAAPPAISVSDATVAEGDAGTINAAFTITLSRSSSLTVTVDCATADGSATAGEDYTAVSQTLSFSPGETSKTVTVSVTGDTTDEADETFHLNLANAANAAISDAQGIGTVTDDDDDSDGDTISGSNGGGCFIAAAVDGDFPIPFAAGIALLLVLLIPILNKKSRPFAHQSTRRNKA
jgi:hypothetical protein